MRWEDVPSAVEAVAPAPLRTVELDTTVGPVHLGIRDTAGDSGADAVAVHLHGLAASSTHWTDLTRMLTSRTRSIAVDLPGFGWSEPPNGFDYRRRSHADVVIALLESLGVGAVHLFGNSFGGAVAIEVAARRPDLVRSLTLVSPAVPDLRPDPRRVSDRRMLFTSVPVLGRRMRRQLAAASARERADKLIRLCVSDSSLLSPDRVGDVVRELEDRAALPWAATALATTTRELVRSWMVRPSESLWSLLHQVQAPALVVWGTDDRLVSVRKAPRTARQLRRGRLLVLPRTGHVAQMERPRLLAAAALGMVDEVAAGRW
ncbi:alpha/beta fold hydrolase [Allosaccharopolyspora coralli]|uniref:Alpha/beta fold hydrolase n=1 Tax=Allosaccharopolyspora coralli TaxID=2665642 RepID=A0A5Q3QDQ3_9PSEU|nr:alpha/beta fold hydrolase [Allosaccharopolyspora coralli]